MRTWRRSVGVTRRALRITLGVVGWCCAWQVPFALPLFFPPAVAFPALALVAAAFICYPAAGRARWRRRRAAELRLRAARCEPWRVLAAVPLLLAVAAAANLVVSRFADPPTYLEPSYRFTALPGGALLLPVWFTVTAPLLEEFGFRGFMHRRLERLLGVPTAVAITAAVFALAHLSLGYAPYYFAMGLIFSYSLLATGSLWVPIILHALVNALASAPLPPIPENLPPGVPPQLAIAAVALFALAAWILPPQRPPVARRRRGRGGEAAGAQFRSMSPASATTAAATEIHLVE